MLHKTQVVFVRFEIKRIVGASERNPLPWNPDWSCLCGAAAFVSEVEEQGGGNLLHVDRALAP